MQAACHCADVALILANPFYHNKPSEWRCPPETPKESHFVENMPKFRRSFGHLGKLESPKEDQSVISDPAKTYGFIAARRTRIARE
jgi:hypothetical protein